MYVPYPRGKNASIFIGTPSKTIIPQHKVDNYGIGKHKKKKAGFHLCGVEARTRLWLLSFCSTTCLDSEKNALFAHGT